MTRIYKHKHAWKAQVALTLEEAVIIRAVREEGNVNMLLAGQRGTVLAVIDEEEAGLLMQENGISDTNGLRGMQVHAHFDGGRVVGISSRKGLKDARSPHGTVLLDR